MAPCKEVLSFLQTLTSSSSNTSPAEEKKEFDDVLLSNMERLREALGERGRFAQLQERLQIKLNAHVRTAAMLKENTEVYRKDRSTKDNHEKVLKPGNTDLIQGKDNLRWTFVETCLELLKFLKESLIELKKESEVKKEESKPGKRANNAPPLPADSLSVGDQKTVLTAIQFVVILGICPNLFPGVGIPLEKRSGFARVLNIQCSIRSERCLFKCVDTLVECIAQPSLGSLILSRHLGDILSGLLQISYAPVTAYTNLNDDKSNTMKFPKRNNDCKTSNFTSSNLSSDNTDLVCKTHDRLEKLSTEAESSVNTDSSVQIHPSDVYKLTQESIHYDYGLFIASSEREKCVCNLQRILDRVYQPIVIRELLLLQGSQQGTGKRSIQDTSGRASVIGEGMKHSVSSSQTPKWMRNVCGQLLSERLMKPNGVKAVLQGFLEGLAGSCCNNHKKPSI